MGTCRTKEHWRTEWDRDNLPADEPRCSHHSIIAPKRTDTRASARFVATSGKPIIRLCRLVRDQSFARPEIRIWGRLRQEL